MAEDDLPGEEIRPDDPRWQRAERKAKNNTKSNGAGAHKLEPITWVDTVSAASWRSSSVLPPPTTRSPASIATGSGSCPGAARSS